MPKKQTNLTKRLLVFVLAALMVFAAAAPIVFAAGSASVTSATVTEGSNVTVTVTFNGGGTNVGAVDAYVRYDSSILQFVSGDSSSGGSGSVHIVGFTSSSTQKSLSYKLKFKALKAGSTNVNASSNEFLSYDGEEIGTASGSGKVTVKAKVTVTPTAKPTAKPTTKPTKKPTVTATPEPKDIDTAIKVKADGKTLYLWRSLKNVTLPLPDGYSAQSYEYKGEKIQGGLGTSGLVFLYLTDSKGENGAYYLYDQQEDSFFPFMSLEHSVTANYIFLPIPKDLVIPEGYEETELKLREDLTVPAWVKQAEDPDPQVEVTPDPAATPGDSSDEGAAANEATPINAASIAQAPEFYLVYAMNAKGEAGFYQYDTLEKTMQRYAGAVEDIVVKEPEPTPTPVPETFVEKIMGDNILMILFFGLAGLCLIFLIVIIVLAIKGRKNKGPKAPKEKKKKKELEEVDWLSDEADAIRDAQPEEAAPAESIEETVREAAPAEAAKPTVEPVVEAPKAEAEEAPAESPFPKRRNR